MTQGRPRAIQTGAAEIIPIEKERELPSVLIVQYSAKVRGREVARKVACGVAARFGSGTFSAV